MANGDSRREDQAPGDSLGDRMKRYEHAARAVLPPRMPIVLRVDGRAFHTYTRGLARPFDDRLIDAMDRVAVALCSDIQGAQIAYVQSDEISVLIHGYKRFASQSWFDGELQKIVSVAASIAAAEMTARSFDVFGEVKRANFDARAFVLPESEVCNYFIWRQQDAVRNSIQMLARSLYSHKECDRKNGAALQEMCFQKGKNWNDLATHYKRGRCAVRTPAPVFSEWAIDLDPPTFTQDRSYIERHLAVEPEEARAS